MALGVRTSLEGTAVRTTRTGLSRLAIDGDSIPFRQASLITSVNIVAGLEGIPDYELQVIGGPPISTDAAGVDVTGTLDNGRSVSGRWVVFSRDPGSGNTLAITILKPLGNIDVA